jgi:hypothetical protein
VLAVQLNETVCGNGVGTAVALKLTPTTGAPFTDTEVVDGEKV